VPSECELIGSSAHITPSNPVNLHRHLTFMLEETWQGHDDSHLSEYMYVGQHEVPRTM